MPLAVLSGASHLGFLGVASALGTPATIDQLACNALAGVPFPDLPGGHAAGISSEDCAVPCQTPSTATLDFNRQHALTQIVAAAFFDASLGQDRSAACWLRRGLAAENPDVETLRR